MSAIIDNNKDSENDYLLPTPSDQDPHAIKIKIYLFSTSKFLEIFIYRKSLV